jgi:tetratricopeptide (TPR) repeat protein
MNLLPLSLRSPDALVRIALESLRGGNYTRALQAADKALAKLTNPQSTVLAPTYVDSSKAGAVWAIKGHAHYGLNDTDTAINAYINALDLNALDIPGVIFLTTELLNRKDLSDRARNIYLNYLSLTRDVDPQYIQKTLDMLEKLSAPDWSRPETIDLTTVWNRAINAQRSDLSWSHRHIGAISIYYGEYWNAISSLEEACRLNPGDFKARQHLALALFKSEEYRLALEHLNRLTGKQVTNHTLLLRAHIHRVLGNHVSAAKDFKSALYNVDLSDEDRLCYVETCINAGYVEDAAEALDLVVDTDDRWTLLCAIVDQLNGRLEDALAGFIELAGTDQFCWQATSRILRLLAENPRVSGALDALDAVLEYYRDYPYWAVRGNVLLGLGYPEESLEAWSRVYFPSEALSETIRSVGQHYFSTLYANGNYGQIVRAVRRELAYGMDCPEVAEIVVAALARYILTHLNAAARPRRFLKDIDLVEQIFANSADPEKLDLLRALVHTRRGHYEKAADFFSSLSQTSRENEEIALQIARCSLHTGSVTDCWRALAGVSYEHPRAAAIRCALSALNGDWLAASQYFCGSSIPKEHDRFKAAVFYSGGLWPELESINGSSAEVADYYRIAHLLETGNRESAMQLHNSLPADEPAKAFSNRLFGWLHLQEAKDFNRQGQQAPAFDKLVNALLLWPDAAGPASCVRPPDSKLPDALLQKVNGVQPLLGMIEAQAASRDPADPVSCHNLALEEFCNGVRNARNNDFEGAIQNWQRSIAYIAAALANETYIAAWLYHRLDVYQADETAEPSLVEKNVVQFYEATFERWSDRLNDRSLRVEAERVSNLGLMLRAELAAARLLKKIGGFPVPDDPFDRICVGPIFISMSGYEKAFASFVTQLQLNYLDVPEFQEDEDPVAALMNMMERWEQQEKEGAVDPADKERLERLFSVLRVSTILHEEGKSDAALSHMPPMRKVDSNGRGPRDNGLRVATRRRSLTRRSPAFARTGGAEDFQESALRLEIDLLTALGEQDVASTENRINEGLEHWSAALSLTTNSEQYEVVAAKIRATALGRANVLRDRDQSAQAIGLLERVNDLCGDEEVRNLLSRFHAVEGVQAALGGDWHTGAIKLRHAVTLNTNSLYAHSNLVNALFHFIDIEFTRNPHLARAYLEEALESMAVCRDLDAHNEEYRETQLLAKTRLNSLRIDAGEITITDLPPDEVLALIFLKAS